MAKLLLQCDNCGKQGKPEEFHTYYDDRDLCINCNKLLTISDLRTELKDSQQSLIEIQNKIQTINNQIKKLNA